MIRELLSEMVLYRLLADTSALPGIARAAELAGESKESNTTAREILGEAVYDIMELAGEYDFRGDIWASYLTFYIIMDENPYSLSAEKRKPAKGAARKLAMGDLKVFYRLFSYDFTDLEKKLGVKYFSLLKKGSKDTVMSAGLGKEFSMVMGELSNRLKNAADEDAFIACVDDYYERFGVGDFGISKAFRISLIGGSLNFDPVRFMEDVTLDDLVGYDIQKKKLTDNTEAFVKGLPANNCLLFGDSGTGKSTSVRAIANMYYGAGLRLIELHKDELLLLDQVIALLRNRNYKFIIYMDDLSFEEDETEYKHLKALMEGGVETRPGNILIYATSNRRHLIRETWSDRSDVSMDNGIHKSDTMEEKLSLANRFGIRISFEKPDQKRYFEIALNACRKNGIDRSDEEIIALAHRWEISHGGCSGRNARQFADDLAGKTGID